MIPDRPDGRTSAAQRAEWLAAYDRTGLSAAAFARQHGLQYTTFCGWRQRRARTQSSPEFVQVELIATPAATELLIELGSQARMRIHSTQQIPLALELLGRLNATPSC